MKVTILGAGAMGTACAQHLVQAANVQVCLWTHRKEHAKQMRTTQANEDYLPEIALSEKLLITSDGAQALAEPELIVVAIPTVHLREALEPLAAGVSPSVPVVSLAKGLEQQTFARPTEIVHQVWGTRPLAALTGPCHAEEFVRGKPTSVIVASESLRLAEQIQHLFNSDTFRVYAGDDLVGAELGGALKNVIAIAAGVSDGLELGDNAKSALLTRGLVELVRFGVQFGGQRETFYGLAGIGDLITTCVSPYGRNRSVGVRLGQGETLDEILASMHAVAEGVWTSRAVRDRARQMQVEMPITEEVCRVLFENKPASQAVQDLMHRELKTEWQHEHDSEEF